MNCFTTESFCSFQGVVVLFLFLILTLFILGISAGSFVYNIFGKKNRFHLKQVMVVRLDGVLYRTVAYHDAQAFGGFFICLIF